MTPRPIKRRAALELAVLAVIVAAVVLFSLWAIGALLTAADLEEAAVGSSIVGGMI